MVVEALALEEVSEADLEEASEAEVFPEAEPEVGGKTFLNHISILKFNKFSFFCRIVFLLCRNSIL